MKSQKTVGHCRTMCFYIHDNITMEGELVSTVLQCKITRTSGDTAKIRKLKIDVVHTSSGRKIHYMQLEVHCLAYRK